MSLLFTDSFDGAIAGADKWDTWRAENVIGTDHGRRGTNGVRTPQVNGQKEALGKFVVPATNRLFCGTWVYALNTNWSEIDRIFRVLSTTTNHFVDLRFSQTGNRFNISGTGLTTQDIGGIGVGQRLTWHFVELMIEFGVAVEVRVNGASIYSDTPSSGSGTPTKVSVWEGGGLISVGAVLRLDDFYILDSDGSAPQNTFLGPSKVTVLKPNGNGARSELVGSDGNSTDNYLLVNDGSDATYVEGDPADGDSYAFEDLADSDDVLGAIQIFRAYDSIGGGIQARGIARSGGTEYDGDLQIMAGSVRNFYQPWPQDPDTATAWTPAGINAAEWGIEFA